MSICSALDEKSVLKRKVVRAGLESELNKFGATVDEAARSKDPKMAIKAMEDLHGTYLAKTKIQYHVKFGLGVLVAFTLAAFFVVALSQGPSMAVFRESWIGFLASIFVLLLSIISIASVLWQESKEVNPRLEHVTVSADFLLPIELSRYLPTGVDPKSFVLESYGSLALPICVNIVFLRTKTEPDQLMVIWWSDCN